MKPPVEVKHLFPKIDTQLISLLRSLSAEEWQRLTLAREWTVKDVAAHLLDGNVRTISGQFEGPEPPAINSYEELVQYLNQLNREWVQAMKRVSPELLTYLLEETGRRFSGIMMEAPLFSKAKYSVAWAGESTSLNWFHLAREYTEKMHHQLQIRCAVNREAELITPELFYPFIDTLMYGLPHTLRHTAAPNNTAIAVFVTGNAGGNWFVQRSAEAWKLVRQPPEEIAATVAIDQGIAWKLFTKGLTPAQAKEHAKLTGDIALAEKVLSMVSVMA